MEAQGIKQSAWMKLEKTADENRFGMIVFILLIIGCLGGVAMNLGAVVHTWSLIAVVVPTMLTLSLLLAVAPMKWILNTFILTILVDLLVILLV